MSGITWNTETDRKLLLFIIQKADIKVDYAAAAAMMSTGDIKVTEMAIQKRMGRLKEMAKTTSGYTNIPTTPKTPKTPKTPRTQKRNRTRAQADDGDDEEDGLPKKKARKFATPKRSKKVALEETQDDAEVKEEDVDNGDVVKPEPVSEGEEVKEEDVDNGDVVKPEPLSEGEEV